MEKGNLLLIDDEEDILSGLKYALEDLADEVFIANRGLKGIEILNKHKIHCVVCDIKMPNMDGVEVIKEVRKKNCEVPFIFYTGHGNEDLMLEVVKYGAFDFLNKPNLDGLEEVVEKGLRKGLGLADVSEDEGAYLSEYQRIINERGSGE